MLTFYHGVRYFKTLSTGAHNINITNNVLFNCVSDNIVVNGENANVRGNVITKVVYRLLYQNHYLNELLGNAQPEEANLPAGIDTMGTFTVTLRNNRVAGGDGSAYKGPGLEKSPKTFSKFLANSKKIVILNFFKISQFLENIKIF